MLSSLSRIVALVTVVAASTLAPASAHAGVIITDGKVMCIDAVCADPTITSEPGRPLTDQEQTLYLFLAAVMYGHEAAQAAAASEGQQTADDPEGEIDPAMTGAIPAAGCNAALPPLGAALVTLALLLSRRRRS